MRKLPLHIYYVRVHEPRNRGLRSRVTPQRKNYIPVLSLLYRNDFLPAESMALCCCPRHRYLPLPPRVSNDAIHVGDPQARQNATNTNNNRIPDGPSITLSTSPKPGPRQVKRVGRLYRAGGTLPMLASMSDDAGD